MELVTDLRSVLMSPKVLSSDTVASLSVLVKVNIKIALEPSLKLVTRSSSRELKFPRLDYKTKWRGSQQLADT